MGDRLRIAWLAPFPVETLASDWQLSRVTASFHPCSWIVNLSRAMARRPDVELHLLTLSPRMAGDQTVTKDGIHYHGLRDAVPGTGRGYPRWFPLPLLTQFRGGVRHLCRELDRIKPDVVHGHGTEFAYGLASAASGRPSLISIQGVMAEYCKIEPTFVNSFLSRTERRAVEQTHYFTCRTSFDSGFVRSVNPSARIFMIAEAMDPVFFANAWHAEDSDHVLFIGSSERRKGLPLLIEALGRIVVQRPSLRLTVIGRVSTQAAEPLNAQIDACGLKGKVEFVGFKKAAEIAEFHRRAQLFVLPSEIENSPNSLAEAMVSGVPVIATAVGGVPSMVEDNVTGLLVRPADPTALSAAILRLLTSKQERERIAANGQRVARERHHPDAVAEQTVAAYREMLANPKQS